MKKFDLVVIGAGAGGLNSAFGAVEAGKSVALIESHKPGGECTWAGCIPSKAMIQIAKEIHTANKYTTASIDQKKVMEKVRELTETAHQAEAVPVLVEAGIHYINGTAKFLNTNTIEVNGDAINAEHIILSTGSSPIVPSIDGLNSVSYLTNENIFQLETLPDSILVLGAGAIGVELSQAMQRLGVHVTLIEQAPVVLPREDKDFSIAVENKLLSEGVEIHTSSTATKVKQQGTTITLTATTSDGEKELHGSAIFVALGRKPNTHTINLDDVGVRYDAKGIKINEYCETSTANIYAIGDVVGPFLFSHSGGHQARALIRNLFGSHQKQPVNLDNMAWCTFMEPELARSGITESEAREQFGDSIKVFTSQYTDLDRAVVDQKTYGMAKVICDEHGHILGASILGERACELLCELQVLRQYNIPFQRLQEVIHPYPGYSELLLSMSLEANYEFNS